MTKQNKTDNTIMKILLDIKEDVGSVKQAAKDIREDQILTHKEIGDRFGKLEDRVNVLEESTTRNGTKIAIFVSVIGSAWVLFSEYIKQKLGIV